MSTGVLPDHTANRIWLDLSPGLSSPRPAFVRCCGQGTLGKNLRIRSRIRVSLFVLQNGNSLRSYIASIYTVTTPTNASSAHAPYQRLGICSAARPVYYPLLLRWLHSTRSSPSPQQCCPSASQLGHDPPSPPKQPTIGNTPECILLPTSQLQQQQLHAR